MFVITKTSKILTNSDDAILEYVLYLLINYLIFQFIYCLFISTPSPPLACFPVTFQLIKDPFGDQVVVGDNSRKKPIEKCLQLCKIPLDLTIACRASF